MKCDSTCLQCMYQGGKKYTLRGNTGITFKLWFSVLDVDDSHLGYLISKTQPHCCHITYLLLHFVKSCTLSNTQYTVYNLCACVCTYAHVCMGEGGCRALQRKGLRYTQAYTEYRGGRVRK